MLEIIYQLIAANIGWSVEYQIERSFKKGLNIENCFKVEGHKKVDRSFCQFKYKLVKVGEGPLHQCVQENKKTKRLANVDINYCSSIFEEFFAEISLDKSPYYMLKGGQCYLSDRSSRGEKFMHPIGRHYCDGPALEEHAWAFSECFHIQPVNGRRRRIGVVDEENCSNARELKRFFGYHSARSRSTKDCFEMDTKTQGEFYIMRADADKCDHYWEKYKGVIIRWKGETVLSNQYGVSILPPSVGLHCFKVDAPTRGLLYSIKVASRACEKSDDDSPRPGPSDQISDDVETIKQGHAK